MLIIHRSQERNGRCTRTLLDGTTEAVYIQARALHDQHQACPRLYCCTHSRRLILCRLETWLGCDEGVHWPGMCCLLPVERCLDILDLGGRSGDCVHRRQRRWPEGRLIDAPDNKKPLTYTTVDSPFLRIKALSRLQTQSHLHCAQDRQNMGGQGNYRQIHAVVQHIWLSTAKGLSILAEQ